MASLSARARRVRESRNPGGAQREWRPEGGGGGARRERGPWPRRAPSRGGPAVRHHAVGRGETQAAETVGRGGDAATAARSARGSAGPGRRVRRGAGGAVLGRAFGLGRACRAPRAHPLRGRGATGARALLEGHQRVPLLRVRRAPSPPGSLVAGGFAGHLRALPGDGFPTFPGAARKSVHFPREVNGAAEWLKPDGEGWK